MHQGDFFDYFKHSTLWNLLENMLCLGVSVVVASEFFVRPQVLQLFTCVISRVVKVFVGKFAPLQNRWTGCSVMVVTYTWSLGNMESVPLNI